MGLTGRNGMELWSCSVVSQTAERERGREGGRKGGRERE